MGMKTEHDTFVGSSAREVVFLRGLDVKDGTKRKPLEAYVNHGRWVADCGNASCNGGLSCTPGEETALCTDCGLEQRVTFPHPNSVRAAEKVLEARSIEATRNWDPRAGETVDDLKAENAIRGEVWT